MPSPIGHALAGVAAGWIVRGARLPSESGRDTWREVALFAALGMAPDLDLVVGLHSGPTHGLGMAVVAAGAAWMPGVAGAAAGRRTALAFACVLAYASHTLLDWLGTDTAPPIGIMALWPCTREYYESGVHLFMGVSREFRQPELFWWPNLATLTRELLVLAPVLGVVFWLRRRPGQAPTIRD